MTFNLKRCDTLNLTVTQLDVEGNPSLFISEVVINVKN